MGLLWVFSVHRAISWCHTLSSCHSSQLPFPLPEQCCRFSLFYPPLNFSVHLVVTMCCNHLLVSHSSTFYGPLEILSFLSQFPSFLAHPLPPLKLDPAKHFFTHGGICMPFYLHPDLIYIIFCSVCIAQGFVSVRQ